MSSTLAHTWTIAGMVRKGIAHRLRGAAGDFRRIVLASTALVGLAIAPVALAAPLNVPDTTTDDQLATMNYDSVTVGNNAILNIGDGAVNITVTSDAGTTIGSGSEIVVFGMATYVSTNPITGGAGGQTITIFGNGTLDAPVVNLGVDADTLNISGTYDVSGGTDLNTGNDFVGLSTGMTVIGSIAGGADTDTLTLFGTGSDSVSLSQFLEFETLNKNTASVWEVTGNGSFVDVNVNGGELTLATGATMAVSGMTSIDPGTTYFVAGTHTASSTTEIDGTLHVLNGGLYTANVTTNINGGTLRVDAGGTYDANAVINGSVGTDTVIVDGTLTIDALQFTFGNGDDLLTVSGTLTANLGGGNVITLGDGDDTVTLNSTGNLALTLTGIDAGVGNQTNGDRLILDGTAGNDFDLSGLETFTNFEHLIKQGDGNWTLRADTVTGATFESLVIVSGNLALVGNWTFTGNVGGTALNIGGTGTGLVVGDGVNPTELMQTDATGAVNVFGNLTVNDMATATFAGPTTVLAGGLVTVNDGGTLNLADLTVQNGGSFTENNGGTVTAAAVEFQAGSTGSIAGVMDATTTDIAGNVQIQSTGDYESTGLVTISGAGIVTILGGSFEAGAALQLSNTGRLTMTTGNTTVQGALDGMDDSVILMQGGLFTANGAVNLSGNAQFAVLGGTLDINDAVLLDGASRMTVDDQFVPSGTVFVALTTRLQGTSALIVSGGAYNATGAITVTDNAILRVDGNGTVSALSTTSIEGSGSLTVLGGGLYQAAGTITVLGGSVVGNGSITGNQLMDNQGGTVSPGLGVGDAGTLSFQGTYQAGAGANFVADIQPGGPADLFAISNSATLAGAIQVNTIAPGFVGVEQFRIISTTAPITGIFDTASLSGVGSGGLIVWVGRVDNAGTPDLTGNNVDVLLAPALSSLQGLTPNQQAVADYLNAGFPGGTIVIEDPLIFVIIQIVGGGPNALDQIGGEVYDSFTTFSFNIARQYGELVDQRVRTLRCAAAGGTGGAFCGPGTTLFAGDRGPNLVSADQLADGGPGLSPGAPGAVSPRGFSPNTHPYGWSVWAAGLGSWLSKDRTTNNLGYSGWTGGGVIGVDLALSQRWIVGVMLGGAKSDIDFSGVSGSGDLEAVTVGLYTAWYGARWFADAAFTYTKTWVEANRDLTFLSPTQTANGRTEGDQYAAHATVGYGFKLGRVSLEASGGMDYVRLRQNSFTETGAGFLNLSVQSRTDDSLRLRFGVRVATAWKVRPNLIVAPNLRVGYARELLDNTRPITSSLAPIGGSFTVHGDEGSRNILTFGGGVQAAFSQGITLFAVYSGEWAGDRTSHSFTGGLRVTW